MQRLAVERVAAALPALLPQTGRAAVPPAGSLHVDKGPHELPGDVRIQECEMPEDVGT